MEVVKLLQSKNRCLKRFLQYSEEFLRQTEAQDHTQVQTYLEEFQTRREAALKTLLLYDRKISESVEALTSAERTDSLIHSLKEALQAQEILTQEILLTDEKVIARIDEEKDRLIKELTTSEKSQQQVKKFRSKWVPDSGATLDGKL